MREYQIHREFEQGSEEWNRFRLGRIGGTSSATLLATNGIDPDKKCCPSCNSVSITYRKTTQDWRCASCKKESFTPIRYANSDKANSLSAGAISMAYRKIGEKVTGPIESYSGYWTERGTDLEPIARKRYEEDQFVAVEQIGYISSEDWLGVSPDGVFIENGRITGGQEIKCPNAENFLRFADTRAIDPTYFNQCQWFLYLTGANWIDFIMFHPDFKIDIIVERVEPYYPWFEVWDRMIPKIIIELERLADVAGLK